MTCCSPTDEWRFSPVRKCAVVFGATSPVGRAVVRAALAEGYELTAVVPAAKGMGYADARVTVVEGDVLDSTGVTAAIVEDAAVFVALERASGSPHVLETAVRHIAAGCRARGVKRIVVLGIGGARLPTDAEPSLAVSVARWVRGATGAHDGDDVIRAVDWLRASKLEWTLVRVAALHDGASSDGKYTMGDAQLGMEAVSREDVAHAMVSCVENHLFVRQTPVVVPAS